MTAAERKAQKARLNQLREEAREIVRDGSCPQCGSELRRNTSLHGWWQCEQFGSTAFRARPDEPSCSFQCFTD